MYSMYTSFQASIWSQSSAGIVPVWNSGCSWCTPSHGCLEACCSWYRAKELAWCWPVSVCAHPADEPDVDPVCTEVAVTVLVEKCLSKSYHTGIQLSFNMITVCARTRTWWSSMSSRVHLTFMSPGLLTWKPSVSWVVGILCHWWEINKKIMRFFHLIQLELKLWP